MQALEQIKVYTLILAQRPPRFVYWYMAIEIAVMAKPPKKWTGAMVKALREKYDLTQGQVAAEIGLATYVPVARWERAVNPTTPTRMVWERLDKLERRLEREAKTKPPAGRIERTTGGANDSVD